jgi:hypothetical protein
MAPRPAEDSAVIGTSVELGEYGRTFATRDRAREIAAFIRHDYQPDAREVVLDLSSVALAGQSFMNEFAGEMGALWPEATLVVRGPRTLVKKLLFHGKRRGLRMRAAADPES